MAARRGAEGLTCGVLRRAFRCQRPFSPPSLAQTLYALRESVPDPADQMRIADTLASLPAFESSLQALRTDDQRYP
jgi:hypothetical protein